MSTFFQKLIIGAVIVVLCGGSYLYYHSLRNPIIEAMDVISEETLGIDLDPIIDEIETMKRLI